MSDSLLWLWKCLHIFHSAANHRPPQSLTSAYNPKLEHWVKIRSIIHTNLICFVVCLCCAVFQKLDHCCFCALLCRWDLSLGIKPQNLFDANNVPEAQSITTYHIPKVDSESLLRFKVLFLRYLLLLSIILSIS